MENLDLGSKRKLSTKFNRKKYLTFSHIEDDTFHPVLGEGCRKLEYITDLCRKRDFCIQAGCNCGIFPDYLAENFKKVITFDPFDENIKHAIKNLSNHNNIEIIKGALLDKPGFCKTLFNTKNCGASKIEFDQNGTVPVFTIDDIIFNNPNQIDSCDLIYLDVEGCEYLAILGAAKTIEQFKPILVLENNGLIPQFPSSLDGSQKFREYIESLGYIYTKRIMRDDIFIPQTKT